MLKAICTFMIFFITLAILCSNNVESRAIHGIKIQGAPFSPQQYVRMIKGQMNSEGSNEDDHGDYLHTKRKSEFLSSLYGLPYALVDTRNSN